MHDSVEITVDPATLAQSRSGSITGRIAITGNGWAFPERLWSDFPLVILSWWLDACRDVSTRPHGNAVCRFMDGDFAFSITSLSTDEWLISCLEGDSPGAVIEARVSAERFQRSLHRAASTIAGACRERGMASPDLEALVAGYGLPPTKS